MDFASWSLRLFRVAGITVRAHWSLLIIVAYDLVIFIGRHQQPWWMAGLMVAILLASILLHEFGHAFAARFAGGDCRVIVMWMMGGLAECDVPMRPWRQFAIAAAGPAVSAGIALGAWGVFSAVEPADPLIGLGSGGFLIWYTMIVNQRLFFFNLLPCYPLDGGRMLMSAGWALIGMRRAITLTLVVSYPCVIALAGWAIWTDRALFFGLSLWLLMTLVQQHQQLRQGGSAFGVDIGYGQGRSAGGWFGRWQERRRQRAAIEREREEEAEQDVLDRLLAKVSEQGLPSLTASERAVLERISRRQRARAAAERV